MSTIEQRKLDFPLTRSPLQGVDVADTQAVRDWLLKLTEQRIRHGRSLKSRFRYLTVDKDEALDVGEPEIGDEPFHTMFFHQLGGRPEIRRRFREGELRVELGDSHRRAAVILEHVPVDGVEHWWLAWRLMGERQGKVGVFHGEWVITEGVGTDAIPEPFREWLHRAGEVTHSDLTETPTQIPPADVLFGTAPLPAPVPQDPVKVAEIVGQLTDAEIARTGIQGIQVLAFRGLVSEQFIVRGQLGCPVDDVIRNITMQGEIDAIAFLFPGVVKLDGVDTRALITIAEVKDGRRGQRVVPLKWRQDGSIEAPRARMRAMPTPEPAQRWIGVKPETEIDMFPMAPDGGATWRHVEGMSDMGGDIGGAGPASEITSRMATPAALLGRWDIESMEMWDHDAINLVEQAHITFDENGGEMAFICVNLWLNCRPKGKGPAVELTFEGSDEGNDVSGHGRAKVVGDRLEGWFRLHAGDESGFVARRPGVVS